MTMERRKELDGLRALAILPVVFFHAGFEFAGLGFLGVDIFFVLSGYLITGTILNRHHHDDFNVVDFYLRRIRRLFPALCFVIIITWTTAALFFLPHQFKDFGQSVAASVLFFSNYFFLIEHGYFTQESELKPLLHTWSLGVEMQFYLIFPFVLLATNREKKNQQIFMLASLAVCSFFFSYMIKGYSPTFGFFSIITRIWEFLLGSLAFLIWTSVQNKNLNLSTIHAGCFAGFTLILTPFLFFDPENVHPDFLILFPASGTALTLVFLRPSVFAGKILCNKLLTLMGLVSYSWYLIHQPVFALTRVYGAPQFGTIERLGLIILTFLAAILCWRLVETKFYGSRLQHSKPKLNFLFSSGVILFVVGSIGHFTNGYEQSFKRSLSVEQQRAYSVIVEYSSVKKNEPSSDFAQCIFIIEEFSRAYMERLRRCYDNHKAGRLILGDSHALDLFRSLARSKKIPFLIGVARGGCRAHSPQKKCDFKTIKNFILENPFIFERIYYNQASFYLLKDQMGKSGTRHMFNTEATQNFPINDNYVDGVARYLKELNILENVYWVGPRLEPHISNRKLIESGCVDGASELKINENIPESFKQLGLAINLASQNAKIRFISVLDELPFNQAMLLNCNSRHYSDSDHWSDKGEYYFSEYLVELLR